MKTIWVRPGKQDHGKHAMHIGEGILGRAGQIISRAVKAREVMICTSSRIKRLHGATLARSLKKARIKFSWIMIPDGEQAKTMKTASQVLEAMAKRQAGRDSCLVAFGGGSVGDLTGFVASIYARGIDYVQIPTTLTAQVDAACGGKTAVNLGVAKNLVGTFYYPQVVVADSGILRTLPLAQLQSGLAEVVKYGVIKSRELFDWIQRKAGAILKFDGRVLEHLVRVSADIKANVVSRDPREHNVRMILNFGHTLGHGIEKARGYEIDHGRAVSIGMMCAARIAQAMHLCARDVVGDLEEVLTTLKLPVRLSRGKSVKKILRAIMLDKKRRDGKLRFVLPTRIGHVEIRSDVSQRLIRQALAA